MLASADGRPGRPGCSPLDQRRTPSVVAVAMLAVLALGVGGCGQSRPVQVSSQGLPAAAATSIVPASASSASSDRYDAPLERRGAKVRVNPVPASYRPRISEAQAFEVFRAQGIFPQTAAQEQADVRLGLYSSHEMNRTWPPFAYDLPAWVIRYDHVAPEANPAGPGSPGDAPTVKVGDGPVDILVFIDAETGRYLNAVQEPATVG